MTADIHFSPLALTRALPFLPLAQGDIDYQVDRRGEPDLINTLLADPATKVVLTRGGLVAVPRGQGDLVDYESVKMRLARCGAHTFARRCAVTLMRSPGSSARTVVCAANA